jgi:hypothetical protein
MYEVTCKNEDCAESIPLPYSILLERLPFHEAINPDAGSRNLACPSCGHVFYYIPEDRCARYYVQGTPQAEDVRLRVGIIECDCAEEKCQVPVEILLPIPVDVGQEYVLEKSDAWTVREAYCRSGKRNGHRFLSLPPANKRTVQFSVP